VADQDEVRLQKVLAAAGLGSRRACEELIRDGRVTVDGRLVTELGTRVDPAGAEVRVDGQLIPRRPDSVYLALNKPRGVVSAMSDDRGRRCLGDLVADIPERMFHVGRLDADSEGLILLTNDGDLAHRIAHPSYELAKVYLAEVPGPVGREVGRRLRQGVQLDDGPVRVDRFRVVGTHGARAQVEVTLHEGRKHIVRRLLAEVGHPVHRLVRLSVGPVLLGDLRPGSWRPLRGDEVRALLTQVADGSSTQR
jgi:23S rRNA pseudouridine2605 synthase